MNSKPQHREQHQQQRHQLPVLTRSDDKFLLSLPWEEAADKFHESMRWGDETSDLLPLPLDDDHDSMLSLLKPGNNKLTQQQKYHTRDDSCTTLATESCSSTWNDSSTTQWNESLSVLFINDSDIGSASANNSTRELLPWTHAENDTDMLNGMPTTALRAQEASECLRAISQQVRPCGFRRQSTFHTSPITSKPVLEAITESKPSKYAAYDILQLQRPRVHFGTTRIREYRIIPDIPDALIHCPITLDWSYSPHERVVPALARGYKSYFCNFPCPTTTAEQRRLRLARVHDKTLLQVLQMECQAAARRIVQLQRGCTRNSTVSRKVAPCKSTRGKRTVPVPEFTWKRNVAVDTSVRHRGSDSKQWSLGSSINKISNWTMGLFGSEGQQHDAADSSMFAPHDPSHSNILLGDDVGWSLLLNNHLNKQHKAQQPRSIKSRKVIARPLEVITWKRNVQQPIDIDDDSTSSFSLSPVPQQAASHSVQESSESSNESDDPAWALLIEKLRAQKRNYTPDQKLDESDITWRRNISALPHAPRYKSADAPIDIDDHALWQSMMQRLQVDYQTSVTLACSTF
jgi:hypothetical protein